MLARPKLLACVTVCLLAGCSPSPTPSPSPVAPTSGSSQASPTATASTSVSPTPTPTWSADQAAAIRAVDDFRAASRDIGADPAQFSEAEMRALLKKASAGNVLTGALTGYLRLKKLGYHYLGEAPVLMTTATRASDVGYALQVIVTKCIDQRALQVVDSAGSEVSEKELGYTIPDFNLRQYTVQKRTGSKVFLVYGIAPTKGECGP